VVTGYEEDAALAAAVRHAYEALDALKDTQLASIPESLRPFSSFGSRDRHVTAGTFLCSVTRDALNHDSPPGHPDCDCVILKGANVRGGKIYGAEEHFTYESLLSETQDEHVIHVFRVPGRCIQHLRETWVSPGPGWYQYSDDIEVDADGLVTRVAGAPIELERLYKVGSIKDLSRVADGPTIGQYLTDNPSCVPEPDAGMQWRTLLLGHFACQVWDKIWELLDKNNDGEICSEELKPYDLDGDGSLCSGELMAAIGELLGYTTSESERKFCDAILAIAGNKGCGELTLEQMNSARSLRTGKTGKL